MLKIPKLDKSIKDLLKAKYGDDLGDQITTAAQKCIDADGTVKETKECLKKAVKSLSADKKADALVLLYHFVIVG